MLKRTQYCYCFYIEVEDGSGCYLAIEQWLQLIIDVKFTMTEPTLTAVFGAGATQTATTLTIAKADLPGLTAAADNRAEQLFTAILLKAKAALTTANQDANPDKSITIEDSFQSLITRNNQQYRQNTQSVNLQKLDTSTGINPDDYQKAWLQLIPAF